MELFKNRSFGALFQDTFTFLKQEGKHFFKLYFTINGIFLLILSVLAYFFSQFYSDFMVNSLTRNTGGNTSGLETFINENLGLFITMAILFFIVALIGSTIAYAFPPLYFKNYLEKGASAFNVYDLIQSYKKHIGKIILFVLTGFLVGILLIIPVGIIGLIMVVTIVGLFLLPLLAGGVMLFYTMALMEFLEGKKGVWDSFGYSWTLLKSKFLTAVGCVGLFYFISYVIQQVLTIIPYVFGMAKILTSPQQVTQNPGETSSTMLLMMLAIFFISFIVGSILGTIVQVNQGIIFYSLKENNENIHTRSAIDQIGLSE